ncbi:MAG: HD domain-containing protein [Oscillospiraceae bacterium]|nr:HD domain-containing protein [Oscillospiraceae bacterium]
MDTRITYEEIRKNEEIKAYIDAAGRSMAALGYTEHSFAHVSKVAKTAGEILRTMGYPEREIELAMIAGFMHDIGNMVCRDDHSKTGAVMAFRISRALAMSPVETASIVTAIGNHDEGTGSPVDEMAAAMILADKSDVRRSRVLQKDHARFDIHDRVNYSVEASALTINEEKTEITLTLTLDTSYCAVAEYFEIFMVRMRLCRRAAEKLGLVFRLIINDAELI